MVSIKDFDITFHDYFYCPDEAYLIIDGYGLAVVELAKKCNERAIKDQLIFPTMYLLRHYIEIATKETYLKYKELSEETIEREKIIGHNLETNELNELNEWVQSVYGQSFPKDVLDVIEKLNDIDEKGNYFRYTHDIKGNKYREKLMDIDTEALFKTAHEITSFFSGLYLFVDEMLENKREMENEN